MFSIDLKEHNKNPLYEKNPTYEGAREYYIYVKTGPNGGIVVSEEPRNDLSFEPTFAINIDSYVDGSCCDSYPTVEVDILKGKDITQEEK